MARSIAAALAVGALALSIFVGAGNPAYAEKVTLTMRSGDDADNNAGVATQTTTVKPSTCTICPSLIITTTVTGGSGTNGSGGLIPAPTAGSDSVTSVGVGITVMW